MAMAQQTFVHDGWPADLYPVSVSCWNSFEARRAGFDRRNSASKSMFKKCVARIATDAADGIITDSSQYHYHRKYVENLRVFRSVKVHDLCRLLPTAELVALI